MVQASSSPLSVRAGSRIGSSTSFSLQGSSLLSYWRGWLGLMLERREAVSYRLVLGGSSILLWTSLPLQRSLLVQSFSLIIVTWLFVAIDRVLFCRFGL